MKQKKFACTSLRHICRSTLAVSIVSALGLMEIPLPARATAPAVTNCADSGAGSLRAAVAGAADGDTIDLSNLSLVCSTITLTTATIDIHQNSLTIQAGSGSVFTGSIYISGGHSNGNIAGYRVFNQSGPGTGTGALELDNLTIANGKYRNNVAVGGCIYSTGSVILNNSTIKGCLATATGGNAGGGGIYAGNTVILNGSTIADNVAESEKNVYGGGLRAGALLADYSTIHGNQATITPGSPSNVTAKDIGGGAFLFRGNSQISNSTVDGNYAYGSGGALFSEGAAITISNSTVSGNTASGGAAAISENNLYGYGAINVSNSTIAFNRSDSAAGAVTVGGALSMQSSIVADNTGINNLARDVSCFHCTLSGADNLVVAFDGVSPPPAGMITVTSDPHLSPLSNHGGLTQTHALLSNSPALAAGNNAAKLTDDQRGIGFPRKSGIGSQTWTDIGAYQRQLFADDEIFYTGMEPLARVGTAWINSIGSDAIEPALIAVDASDNVFVANTGNNAINDLVAAGGYAMENVLGSGFIDPYGVAVDSSGNVYATDRNGVEKILAAGGYLTVQYLSGSIVSASGIAVDASGNVFVADNLNNAIKELVAAGGYTTVKTLGSGFSDPNGVAIDHNGNVFVADTGDNAVKEILAAGGYVTVKTLGSGFNIPIGIAVDLTGNVFVASTGDHTVKEILAQGGYTSVTTLENSFGEPIGVAVDVNGNVFVSDENKGAIFEILTP